MDLKQLISLSTVPTTVTPKTVKVRRPIPVPESEWADIKTPEFSGEFAEETVDIHVRRYSGADEIELGAATDRERIFVAIHRCVVNRDATPVFETRDQVMSLSAWLSIPLFNAVSEVNDKRPKASRRTTSSGSKSRSRSVDGPQKNGNTP